MVSGIAMSVNVNVYHHAVVLVLKLGLATQHVLAHVHQSDLSQ